MYIKRLVVQTIKSLRTETALDFASGLNFIAGDNNTGKSTVFEAISFLAGDKYDSVRLFSSGSTSPSRVELTLAGEDLRERLESDVFSKLVPYLHSDHTGESLLRVERSTAQRTVDQGGRSVNLDVKKLTFWNPERDQFENPTGIDALFKALIDFEIVWADTTPADTADFGSTKTLGRLFAAATTAFYETDVWLGFREAHGAAFGAAETSLAGRAQGLAEELGELVQDQYGRASARFEFELPDPTTFLKSGLIKVDDGGTETPLADKGTGMQRAFALAIIQLWAKYATKGSSDQKPLVLLLDEPETWLHPVAQRRLASALAAIASSQQVFVITHSPYLLQRFESGRHELMVFAGEDSIPRHRTSNQICSANGRGPSLGAITYHAFDVCTEEFHNELYGAVAEHLYDPSKKNGDASEREIDGFLVGRGLRQEFRWIRTSGESHERTLPVYVRNSIHHPENPANDPLTPEQLEESTRALLAIVSGLQSPDGS